MTSSLPLRPAVSAGQWVAISGQIGISDGALVAGGVAAQTRQAISNFCAVLAHNGLTPGDVVKTTVFLTSMADFATLNDEYVKTFGTLPPARSTIGVQDLPLGALVEIEGWAHRGAAAGGATT